MARQSVHDWQEAGRPAILERAQALVADMTRDAPDHLPRDREQAIRDAFEIHLPKELS